MLSREIEARLARIEEFGELRRLCQELRTRCWLFGGTAAAYGHYVKWDLLRESGDSRFQPDRFDYDYTNIFRSNQDADIVIDGTVQQAEELERRLKAAFPHFEGSKQVWEVRLLRDKRGDKEALLDSPDFLHQHTDSNSTGMIEVTQPRQGEPVIRDLRDWEARERAPQFLKDIQEGRLHYYYSKLHATTSRAQAGLNPPILSVIRYLTKAFQYELETRPEDWEALRRVISEFDPVNDLTDPYVQRWVEKNGKKLIQNAVDVEFARKKLDETGLRAKLLLTGSPAAEDSLAWWLDREPLRSSAVGQGGGKTAAEIFNERGWPSDLIVAHETRDFEAYESITRAHTGAPNALTSRGGVKGETALHGEGFYTRVGRTGARGTNITIRFKVLADAREGTDFLVHDDYLVFRNKSALRVIPERLDLEPLAFFKLLLEQGSGETPERALYEKLKRRLTRRLNVSGDELGQLVKLIEGARSKPGFAKALYELLTVPSMASHPKGPLLLESLVALDPTSAVRVINAPRWRTRPEALPLLLKLLGDPEKSYRVARAILMDSRSHTHPQIDELVKAAIEHEDSARLVIEQLLTSSGYAGTERAWKHVDEILAKHPKHRQAVARHLLSHPGFRSDPRAYQELRNSFTGPESTSVLREKAGEALLSETWRHDPRFEGLFQLMLDGMESGKNPDWRDWLTSKLRDTYWPENASLRRFMLAELARDPDSLSQSYRKALLRLFGDSEWTHDGGIRAEVFRRIEEGAGQAWLIQVLGGPGYRADARAESMLRTFLASGSESSYAAAVKALSSWFDHATAGQLLAVASQRSVASPALAEHILGNPEWQNRPDFKPVLRAYIRAAGRHIAADDRLFDVLNDATWKYRAGGAEVVREYLAAFRGTGRVEVDLSDLLSLWGRDERFVSLAETAIEHVQSGDEIVVDVLRRGESLHEIPGIDRVVSLLARRQQVVPQLDRLLARPEWARHAPARVCVTRGITFIINR